MRKTVRRASLILALTPLVSVPATAALAAATGPATGPGTTVTTTVTTTTPAPSSSASADAAKVAGVIAVGSTSSSAGSSGGSASADSLDLLGQRVVGGDSKDPGKPASGNLVGTGSTPLGDAEVAPYSAAVTHSSGASTADADAALAHADLAGLLEVWVLHSHSHSDWSNDQSNGSSSSDGAEISGGGQDVKVLHAEAASGHKGSSALLVVDGQQIGSSDQANGMCALDLSPIAQVLCLTATGGAGANGETTSAAQVVGVTGMVPGTTLSGAGTNGGKAAPAAAAKRPTASSPSGGTARAAGASGPAALPFTGAETGLLATYGALLAGLGTAIVTVARRRRPQAARG